MAGRECYHYRQWIEEGEPHDCWTTTEATLTADLSEDLQDAWQRLRETAVGFGNQRIYASHHSIMFSRKSCYFFVRPKRKFLELCVFLGRALKAPQVRRVDRASKSKIVHFFHIRHRDEVEAPITDWLREAFELSDALPRREAGRKKPKPKPKRRPPQARTKTREFSQSLVVGSERMLLVLLPLPATACHLTKCRLDIDTGVPSIASIGRMRVVHADSPRTYILAPDRPRLYKRGSVKGREEPS